MTRNELEHLEATDSVAFMTQVEGFAAGNGDFLCKDNYEDIVEKMMDESEYLDPIITDADGMLVFDNAPDHAYSYTERAANFTRETVGVIKDGIDAMPGPKVPFILSCISMMILFGFALAVLSGGMR